MRSSMLYHHFWVTCRISRNSAERHPPAPPIFTSDRRTHAVALMHREGEDAVIDS